MDMKMIRCLKAQVSRFPARLSKARQKRKNSPNGARFKERSYAPQLRALAHQLVQSGCTHGKVGHLIKKTAFVFGIQIDHAMSRRTVSRAVLKGWVASRMQLGYEMKRAGCTLISRLHTIRANK